LTQLATTNVFVALDSVLNLIELFGIDIHVRTVVDFDYLGIEISRDLTSLLGIVSSDKKEGQFEKPISFSSIR
jgi:hypothetical protein